MASASLPKPGSKFGPCVEPCSHRDCRQTRTDAATPCHVCTQAIGYDEPFYRAHSGELAHVECLERAVEHNDPIAAVFS